MMGIAVILIITIISAVACYYIAKNRQANPVFWVVMALIFGPLAIPFACFAKPEKLDHLAQ